MSGRNILFWEFSCVIGQVRNPHTIGERLSPADHYAVQRATQPHKKSWLISSRYRGQQGLRKALVGKTGFSFFKLSLFLHQTTQRMGEDWHLREAWVS